MRWHNQMRKYINYLIQMKQYGLQQQQGKIKMFTEEDLQHLLAKYIQYTKRQKPSITVESLPETNLNDVINHLNSTIQKQSLMVEQIANETVAIIKIFWEIYRQNLAKFDQFNMEVDHKNIQNQELRDKLASIDKQREVLLTNQKLLQQQLQGLRVSMADMHESFIKQNQQIKQKLEDEQILADKSIQVLQQIKDQTLVNNEITLSYQQKAQLEAKLNQLRHQIKSKDQQIIKSERKLNWEQKQKQQLQLTVKEKNLIIEELTSEIQELKDTLKQNYGHIEANLQLFQPPQQFQQEEPNKQMLKLSEDVEHKEFQRKLSYGNQLQSQQIKTQENIISTNQLNIPQALSPIVSLSRSQSEAAQSIAPTAKSLSRSQSKHKKIINLDPYYCHFVLLSQTVKITQNSQNYFNIDIKPYYKEIIVQKIPMHEWKQWIISKFQSLAEQKQKQNSSQKSNSFNREIKISKNKSKQMQRESKGFELLALTK